MPLRDDLRGIGQRIVDFHDRGGEPPYLLYVYPPTDEWSVRRDLKELQLWLEAPDRGIRCVAISLADLFWQALEAEGWIDELIAQETDAGGDETVLPDIYRSVSEILRLPPSLPDRVVATVEQFDHQRTAVHHLSRRPRHRCRGRHVRGHRDLPGDWDHSGQRPSPSRRQGRLSELPQEVGPRGDRAMTAPPRALIARSDRLDP